VSSTEDVGRVTKIDPRTNTIAATTRLGTGIPCLVVGGGYVWAGDNGTLWKLSLAGDVLGTFDEPGGCGGMSYANGGLWLAGCEGPSAVVQRIDAQTDRVTRYRTGHLLTGLGASTRTIAVSMLPTTGDLLAGVKGRVLRISFASSWPNLTDPALAGVPGENRTVDAALEEQLQDATCARLLTLRGQQLVPEVATTQPRVSDDGRTFTFHISRRYRFSPPSNAIVTAAAFKYSIERALSPRLGPNPPGLKLVPDLVGLRAYRAGAAAHISGITTTGATLRIHLTRAAPDFPERITASYFCPVPVGTPLGAASGGRGGLDQPLPSAGPFYLSGSLGGAILVLRRNPGYGGRRPRHLDAIVYRTEYRLDDAVAGVISGKADYVAERGAALAGDTPIARRFGRGDPVRRRFLLTPLLGIDELAFDPRSHSLHKSAVRRAVSLALDRRALASVLGDVTTDRYLPPGMRAAGDDRRAYRRDTPDVRAARSLARGSHGRLRLAVCAEPACLQIGRIVRADLQQIGIGLQLRRYVGSISPLVRRPGADITLARVLAVIPEPVAFLRQALGAAAPRERLNEIARMARPRRIAAATDLELQLLRGPAPAAAFGNPAIPELFSGRVGCRTSSPVSFGTDLAALCLKH
jgi:hypothetical protein